MPKYKIGVTEAGDAGADLSWVNEINNVHGAIVITKRISPDFYDAVLAHKDKLIVHATLTGYGHSVLEPGVPSPYEEFDAINTLVRGGFPQEKVVIRVDPIIPTEKGLKTALNAIKCCMDVGFKRFRISVIDMYPHVRQRFKEAGLPLPYGEQTFANREQMQLVDTMLKEAIAYWVNEGHPASELRIEACAEPYLNVPLKSGCISEYDLRLLGLDADDADSTGYQRKACMCYSGKTELLRHKHRCEHNCLYCYWKD